MPLTQYIALVSETDRITASELNQVAAAIDKQVKRDFNKPWGLNSSVNAFSELADVPTDYWPVVIRDSIPYPAAGIHLDDDGQPYALVRYSPDWSLTTSHEVLEMLVDPFGNRLVAGQSPKPGQGRVNFLVEVCDPSEDAAFGYTVNDVLVSDFYFESFFAPVAPGGAALSYTGALTQPRTILRGGYLSWEVPETREWWQITWFEGNKPSFRSLGVFDAAKYPNLRAFIDENTIQPQQKRDKPAKASALRAAGPGAKSMMAAACTGRAQRLSLHMSAVIGRAVTTGTGGATVRYATTKAAGRKSRAERLHRQINALTEGPEPAKETPHGFVQRRMGELAAAPKSPEQKHPKAGKAG